MSKAYYTYLKILDYIIIICLPVFFVFLLLIRKANALGLIRKLSVKEYNCFRKLKQIFSKNMGNMLVHKDSIDEL